MRTKNKAGEYQYIIQVKYTNIYINNHVCLLHLRRDLSACPEEGMCIIQTNNKQSNNLKFFSVIYFLPPTVCCVVEIRGVTHIHWISFHSCIILNGITTVHT